MDVQAMIRALDEVARHIRGEIQLNTVVVSATPIDVGGLRKSLGLSQTEFAGRFGVNLQNLQRWESGADRPGIYEESLLWHIGQDPGYVAQEFKDYCRSRPQKGRCAHIN